LGRSEPSGSARNTVTRLKFAGKERDQETGRSMTSWRDTTQAHKVASPDEFPGGFVAPLTGPQVAQPASLPYSHRQTVNKCASVRNKPLRYVDPDCSLPVVRCIWSRGEVRQLKSSLDFATANQSHCAKRSSTQ